MKIKFGNVAIVVEYMQYEMKYYDILLAVSVILKHTSRLQRSTIKSMKMQ